MKDQSAALQRPEAIRRELIENPDYLLRHGILQLLAVKDSDVRILTVEQCCDAVDKGLHSGGAFSASIGQSTEAPLLHSP
jgi:transketolase